MGKNKKQKDGASQRTLRVYKALLLTTNLFDIPNWGVI
jgi:hypothetical protein